MSKSEGNNVSLSEKWENLQPTYVDETDLFEIVEEGKVSSSSKVQGKEASLEDLPPEFFDFFMVIKAS